jgi:serine/threonine-protein kinase
VRALVGGALALSALGFALHLSVVRPYLWPAGAGLTLSGDVLPARLADPDLMLRIRPPDLRRTVPQTLTVTAVMPGGEGERLGITTGTTTGSPLPDAESALRLWRDEYRKGPRAAVTLTTAQRTDAVTLQPQSAWRADGATRRAWLRQHVGAVVLMAGFLAGATTLLLLGSRGMTATLITLAMIFTAAANGGPLLGAELRVPIVGELLLLFSWTATAVSFPIIGIAVLHFPTRARILDGRRWIYAVLCALPAPVLVISLVAAAFLLGSDAMVAPLAWFATNAWLFDASFTAALAANVAIVIEGIRRYRTNVDANERRRIQIVVYTGVPAVFAYAINVGVPLISSLAGRPVELPWLIAGLLHSVVLLPALALPYAVAVKHVFSPRTVLRRSLQYAFARRTLSVLIVLPMAALVISFITQRDRPLGEIILGQPLFYVISVALIALGLRYRDQAQRALDKKFFRAEYDAREILVALANRVPYEHDAINLIAAVLESIDEALHPETMAVLAGEDGRLDVLASRRMTARPLDRDSGLVTLLRWSDAPLEIYLDDERSPAARLPAADRAWLDESGATLLVPMFAGSGSYGSAGGGSAEPSAQRPLIGVIALGEKRSEEPYTAEDRKLLSGISAQMSVALDLSRLRKRASASERTPTTTPTLTPTMVVRTEAAFSAQLVMCHTCRRCYDLSQQQHPAVCPDDGTKLQVVLGMPPVVDGKYRVEAVIGRGGMGAVFRAKDVRLERDVAVKVVRAELVSNPESRARFQREAQIVARLQHPGIVTVFDYGALPDGAAFLIMEYVRGEDLRHVLKREKALPAARAIAIAAGVAASIDAAHRAGVLHRDLKPENILLPESHTGPKVLDFGVAKLTDTATTGGLVTQSATVVGTPAYMAPEQLRGEVVDGRADIYSLAVLTYEALTGRLPYGAGSFIDVGVRQAEGAARVSFEGVPPTLAGALQRAFSLSREERPATAAAFADELTLLL